jgi:alpha-tubulin suppressor-like RCC1 family protein
MNNLFKKFGLSKSALRKYFSESVNESKDNNLKTHLYLWISNVSPGRRAADYKNKFVFRNTPTKVEFYEGLNPKYVYLGPRHSAVVTDNGELYTFGSGNWGVLGHGNENSVAADKPKPVEYFKKNNIKIKKVSMGDFHTVALSEKGEVYTWGYGGRKGFLNLFFVESGALGHGDRNHTFIPKKIKYFSDNDIKINDIACGTRHCVALAENGDVYTWGRGEYGLLGNGSNSDKLIPMKNDLIDMFIQENPENKIVKIDCADEYTGALTKSGELYVWGKNNQGQLGIGAGMGIEYTESEKMPISIPMPDKKKVIDFSCGENGMMIQTEDNLLYKTGWRIDYTPALFDITKITKPRLFFCGNSYYCMIAGIIL